VFDNVIYFPSIDVPARSWFTQMLLYWDTIGTIVPKQYAEDPSYLHPYTLGLASSGLVTRLVPNDEMWRDQKIQWLDLLSSFRSLMATSAMHASRRTNVRRDGVRIHVDKLGHDLASELRDLGLAKYDDGGTDDTSWYVVERWAAQRLMIFIAEGLAKTYPGGMMPITDNEDYLDVYTGQDIVDASYALNSMELRRVVLQNILPVPDGRIEPLDLADFKKKHRDQLYRFRDAIETDLVLALREDNESLRNRLVETTKRKFEGQIQDITKKMEERHWPKVVLAGLAVAGAGSAFIAAAAVGDPVTATCTALSIPAAVISASNERSRPAEYLKAPMAYAALVKQRQPKRGPEETSL
jgi:uncharacterized protein YfaT (DUF1175 family)